MLVVFASWALWGLMLLLQNAAFTWTSRARNTDSLREHGTAAFFSNSVYFANLIVGVDKIREGLLRHNYTLLALTALFYTVFTMTGSLYSHYLLIKRKNAKSNLRS